VPDLPREGIHRQAVGRVKECPPGKIAPQTNVRAYSCPGVDGIPPSVRTLYRRFNPFCRNTIQSSRQRMA